MTDQGMQSVQTYYQCIAHRKVYWLFVLSCMLHGPWHTGLDIPLHVKLQFSKTLTMNCFENTLKYLEMVKNFYKYKKICSEAVGQRCSVKTTFLEISQNSQENTCARVPFLRKLQVWGLQLYQKETLAQAFSCEFCEISRNTFYYRTPLLAASENSIKDIRQPSKVPLKTLECLLKNSMSHI